MIPSLERLRFPDRFDKDFININSIDGASGFIEKPFNIFDIKKVLACAQGKSLSR